MSGGGGQEREIKKIQWEESVEGHLFGMRSPGKYKAESRRERRACIRTSLAPFCMSFGFD